MSSKTFMVQDTGEKILRKIIYKKRYDNDLSSIINIYFYETFSTLTQTFSACAQLFRHPV